MIFETVAPRDAEGGLVVHTTRLADRILKKGHVLTGADLADLEAAAITRISIVRIEAGDTDENQAARRIAEKLAGGNLIVGPATTGRCNLYAAHHGLLRVDRAMIDGLNRRNMGVMVSTLEADRPVEHGRMVATVKVIPFSVPETALAAAEADLDTGIVLHPFQPLTTGLIQTRIPGQKPSLLEKGSQVMAGRVETYGGRIDDEIRCQHETEVVAGSIATQIKAGARIVLILGGASTADARDVVPAAMRAAGGRLIQFGIPVDPGNLLSLGLLDGVPLVGLPGCSRSPKPNGADWVLDWLFAGLPPDDLPLLDWGVGGLLEEVGERLQRREPDHAPAPHAATHAGQMKVAAVILAAGQSKRFGQSNKLLATLEGRELLAHAVAAARQSRADPIIIVTGHEADRIRESIGGPDIRFVHNPHYGEGMSTSLRAGIGAAAEAGVDGAAILLGDMPGIDSGLIDALIASFENHGGGAICAPSHQGQRGNPVLWPADLFAEMMEGGGDSGARQLLKRHSARVRLLAWDSDSVLRDVDTPEGLKTLRL